MARVVICGVARTPIGKFRGSLSNLSAVELGIRSVKELLNRCNIDASSGIIDEVLFGQVLQVFWQSYTCTHFRGQGETC